MGGGKTLPTLQIKPDRFNELRQYLESLGFAFEERPYQVFLARKSSAVINLFNSGKITWGGSDEKLLTTLYEYIITNFDATVHEKEEKKLEPLNLQGARIGTDEVGKGDYFGPLVIAGALVDQETEKILQKIGVKDSKTLSDTTISNMASQIRKILGLKKYEVITISPLKYNILYKKMKNVNKILGWGHARLIENLLSNGIDCKLAVADQFGDPGYIRDALMSKGRHIELIQAHKAERDIAVATASVLARDKFLRKMEELAETYQIEFPKGASNVVEFGKKLILQYGSEILANVAKLHFATTHQITGGAIPIIPDNIEAKTDIASVPRETTQKDKQDTSLECYNLIANFESEMREFIKKELSAKFGENWWNECIPKEIRSKCEIRAQEEFSKKGRQTDHVDCLEFPHYDWIITDERNWNEVFKKFFRKKELFKGQFEILKDIRNLVMHSREVNPQQKINAASAIRILRPQMHSQLNIEEFL